MTSIMDQFQNFDKIVEYSFYFRKKKRVKQQREKRNETKPSLSRSKHRGDKEDKTE